MKTIGLMGCAAASLTLVGCGLQDEGDKSNGAGTSVSEAANARLAFGPDSYVLPDCDGAAAGGEPSQKSIKKTVNLILPMKLDIGSHGRDVWIADGAIGVTDAMTHKKDFKHRNTGKKFEPFHVFTDSDLLKVGGFILVRVVNESKGDLVIDSETRAGINGVASSDSTNSKTKMLCSGRIADGSSIAGSDAEQVARFYVDVAKFAGAVAKKQNDLPFNIWVRPSVDSDTLVIIDPKVRNEG